MTTRLYVVAFWVFVSATGCDAYRAGSIGYAQAPLTNRHHAVVQLRDAIGSHGFLWDFRGHGRIGKDTQLVGAGIGVLKFFGAENARIFPHLAPGLTAIELGRIDQKYAVGAMSPYLEFGINWLWNPEDERKSFNLFSSPCHPPSYWIQTGGFGLSLTGAVQYDVRLTDQPNDFTWRLSLGVMQVRRNGPTQYAARPKHCDSR